MLKKSLSLLLIVGLLFCAGFSVCAVEEDPVIVYGDDFGTQEPVSSPDPSVAQASSVRERLQNFRWDVEDLLEESFSATMEALLFALKAPLYAAGWLLMGLAVPFMLLYSEITGVL